MYQTFQHSFLIVRRISIDFSDCEFTIKSNQMHSAKEKHDVLCGHHDP